MNCTSKKNGLSVRNIGNTRVFILCCFVITVHTRKGYIFCQNWYIRIKALGKGVGPWEGALPYKLSWVFSPAPPLGFTSVNNRDLTIRERRRQCKRRWKIGYTSFETFSSLCQVTQLLYSREVWLELKRGERVPRCSLSQVNSKFVHFTS